jgi:hypothetical protein
MIERWAKPVVPIGVEEAGKMLSHGGRLYNIPTYILEPEDVERVREGYVCLMCLEQHEEHHPESCLVCHFPMRAIQDEVFAVMYQGEVSAGPSSTLAEEWERAKDAIERGEW